MLVYFLPFETMAKSLIIQANCLVPRFQGILPLSLKLLPRPHTASVSEATASASEATASALEATASASYCFGFRNYCLGLILLRLQKLLLRLQKLLHRPHTASALETTALASYCFGFRNYCLGLILLRLQKLLLWLQKLYTASEAAASEATASVLDLVSTSSALVRNLEHELMSQHHKTTVKPQKLQKEAIKCKPIQTTVCMINLKIGGGAGCQRATCATRCDVWYTIHHLCAHDNRIAGMFVSEQYCNKTGWTPVTKGTFRGLELKRFNRIHSSGRHLTEKKTSQNKLWCKSTTNPVPVLRIAASRGFSELTKNVIRSSHGNSTRSLKVSCKSVQPFARNVDKWCKRN